MATDAELLDKKREHKQAMWQYRKYRWFTYGLGFCLFMGISMLLDPKLSGDAGIRSFLVALLVVASLFSAEWISALVFKRKSRPWRSRHPEDENPRR